MCFHKYIEIKNTGKYSYRECKKCGKRKLVVLNNSGYQPIDKNFLREK